MALDFSARSPLPHTLAASCPRNLPNPRIASLSREQCILLPQILPNIRLPERHNTRRVQLSRLGRTPRTHAKSQRRVVHAQHHDALVLWTVLAPAPHVRLEHVAAVQERHLAVGLDPHLVARVRRDDGQRGYVEAEFPCLGEFSEAQAEGEQVVARDRGREVGEGFAHIVHTGAL
jgi:hypothetical protein